MDDVNNDEEEKQSWSKYDTYEKWRDNFYLKTAEIDDLKNTPSSFNDSLYNYFINQPIQDNYGEHSIQNSYW